MTDPYAPVQSMLDDQAKARANAQARWMEEAGELFQAHKAAFNALCSMMKRHVGRHVARPLPHLEGQMCLNAQFVMGIELVESTICHGLYSQAAALIKQELETVAAVAEFAAGKRKDGKTPHVKAIESGQFGKVYGLLNDISHVSQHGIAKLIVARQAGAAMGANLLPTYNRELARFLYGQHIYLIISIARSADVSFREMFGEGISRDEVQQIAAATMILLREGILVIPDDAVGPEHDWMRDMIARPA